MLGLAVSVRARVKVKVMARVRNSWGTKRLGTKRLGYEISGNLKNDSNCDSTVSYSRSFPSNPESLTSHNYVHGPKLLRTNSKNRLARQTSSRQRTFITIHTASRKKETKIFLPISSIKLGR